MLDLTLEEIRLIEKGIANELYAMDDAINSMKLTSDIPTILGDPDGLPPGFEKQMTEKINKALEDTKNSKYIELQDLRDMGFELKVKIQRVRKDMEESEEIKRNLND